MENNALAYRDAVEQYLRIDRSYNSGQMLYLRLPNYNRACARTFNYGESPFRLARLHYELAKAVGIPDRECRDLLAAPLVPETTVSVPEASIDTTPADTTPAEVSPMEALEKSREWIGEQAYQTALANLQAAQDEKNGKEVCEAFASDPKAAQGRQLVEQFPFMVLDSTPQEIKDLAEDKVIAWMQLQVARDSLFKAVSEQDCYQAAKQAVESLGLNQQVWDELEAYRDTGKPLYVLPQLKMLEYKEKCKVMPAEALVKELSNTESNISRSRSPEKKAEWTEKKQYVQSLIAALKTGA